MPETILTPVGRLVWGNPTKITQKKDIRTKQLILNKEGKPVEQWVFGVAFSKNDFLQHIKPYFDREAATIFPHGVPTNFAWKYKDGDSIDKQGKPYSSREGWGGCYVLNFSTEAFAPPVYKLEGTTYRQIGANEIKTGDYVAISLSIKANKPADTMLTPGLYVNPNGIELVGYGPEIITTTDPTEMFGGGQKQLPPGASMTPVSSAPQGVTMPGMPAATNAQPPVQQFQQAVPGQAPYGQPVQQPQQFQQQPQQFQQAVPGQAPYGQPVQQPQQFQQAGQLPPPAHDFVQNAGQPQGFTNAGAVQQQVNQQQAYGYPPANGVAMNATQYPSNNMPGVPQR